MSRVIVIALVLGLVAAGTAGAQSWVDDLGVGVAIGMMQPMGGEEDFEDLGMVAGFRIRKPLTERICVALDYRHGETQSGGPQTVSPTFPGSRFAGWGEAEWFKTSWNFAGLTAIYDFKTEGSFTPYVSGGLGLTMWEVEDWRDSADPVSAPEGYDTEGTLRELRGTNLTASIGAGVEIFLSNNVAVDIGGRYHQLLQNDRDNVGLSVIDGPNYVDANNGIIEGALVLSYYFGAGDCDGDGIFGSKDKCPKIKEDFDGFEDEDGCPDPDNDGDGFLDAEDECPDDAEDFDGDADEDGCPDVDRDGDGIDDEDDACPDKPEDFDGFKDKDGCPDPDNDGDGVPDVRDDCPDTPAGTLVDETGCARPEITPQLVAVMVNFELASAELDDVAAGKLDALVEFLREDEAVIIDIGGHACDLGGDTYNQSLSERRAEAVRDYLAEKGVDPSRMTVVGYGEQAPLVSNDSEEQRRQNRRAMITPSRP